MKIIAQGDLNQFISIAANPMYPAFIIKGRDKNLMIDAGINLFGPLYLKSLREILGDENRLDYLFLTHSHYDHLGSVSYLKRHIPNLKVGGSPYISDLMAKPSVLERMSRLSEIQRPAFRDIFGSEDVTLRPFSLDLRLLDGDRIDLGGLTCEILAVPGHTRDCLAYYIREINTLFPGEAAGVPEGKDGIGVQVEFLSSYDDYVKGIKKMAKLRPKTICIGHGFVFTDQDAAVFLNESLEATSRYRELLENYIKLSGGDVDKAILEIIKKEYDGKGTIFQERNAYITNLTAQVKLVYGLMEKE